MAPEREARWGRRRIRSASPPRRGWGPARLGPTSAAVPHPSTALPGGRTEPARRLQQRGLETGPGFSSARAFTITAWISAAGWPAFANTCATSGGMGVRDPPTALSRHRYRNRGRRVRRQSTARSHQRLRYFRRHGRGPHRQGGKAGRSGLAGEVGQGASAWAGRVPQGRQGKEAADQQDCQWRDHKTRQTAAALLLLGGGCLVCGC